MILEAHVGWSPLLGWCLRRFQRPVAVVSVVASGVMVIALLVLCLSVAPARADITPGYDPYTHTGGSHSGRTGDKECTPREDFINTVFWYRGSGSRNMQRWLSSVLGYTNVYNGPLAPKFHVHFDNRSNWDWSMHGLPSWYRYTSRSAQNSMGTDYLGVPARDHIRLFAGPYKDRHRYLDWSVGSAHYDVAVWDMYGSTWYPWHLVLSYEDYGVQSLEGLRACRVLSWHQIPRKCRFQEGVSGWPDAEDCQLWGGAHHTDTLPQVVGEAS